jgi:hypothetical protein
MRMGSVAPHVFSLRTGFFEGLRTAKSLPARGARYPCDNQTWFGQPAGRLACRNRRAPRDFCEQPLGQPPAKPQRCSPEAGAGGHVGQKVENVVVTSGRGGRPPGSRDQGKKTYRGHDRKGREIRVTIPED